MPQVTAEYRHFRGGDHILGERPTERADFLAMKARVVEKHRIGTLRRSLARVIDRLRAETVVAKDSADFRAAELEDGASSVQPGTRHPQSKHSTRTGPPSPNRPENTERLHTEIERLNALIKEMEGTKAWRLHRALERLRGR